MQYLNATIITNLNNNIKCSSKERKVNATAMQDLLASLDNLQVDLPASKSASKSASKQDNLQDLFAKLDEIFAIKPRTTRRGKSITLPRTAMEQRIYISKSTRQLRYASYTDKPIRDGYKQSKMQYYNAVGAASLSANDIRYLARQSNYNVQAFRRLLKAKLGREVCMSEIVEFINAATKNRTVQTFAARRKSVPEGVKVYAK